MSSLPLITSSGTNPTEGLSLPSFKEAIDNNLMVPDDVSRSISAYAVKLVDYLNSLIKTENLYLTREVGNAEFTYSFLSGVYQYSVRTADEIFTVRKRRSSDIGAITWQSNSGSFPSVYYKEDKAEAKVVPQLLKDYNELESAFNYEDINIQASYLKYSLNSAKGFVEFCKRINDLSSIDNPDWEISSNTLNGTTTYTLKGKGQEKFHLLVSVNNQGEITRIERNKLNEEGSEVESTIDIVPQDSAKALSVLNSKIVIGAPLDPAKKNIVLVEKIKPELLSKFQALSYSKLKETLADGFGVSYVYGDMLRSAQEILELINNLDLKFDLSDHEAIDLPDGFVLELKNDRPFKIKLRQGENIITEILCGSPTDIKSIKGVKVHGSDANNRSDFFTLLGSDSGELPSITADDAVITHSFNNDGTNVTNTHKLIPTRGEFKIALDAFDFDTLLSQVTNGDSQNLDLTKKTFLDNAILVARFLDKQFNGFLHDPDSLASRVIFVDGKQYNVTRTDQGLMYNSYTVRDGDEILLDIRFPTKSNQGISEIVVFDRNHQAQEHEIGRIVPSSISLAASTSPRDYSKIIDDSNSTIRYYNSFNGESKYWSYDPEVKSWQEADVR